jgi:sugar phosphate isomerase/epimerase
MRFGIMAMQIKALVPGGSDPQQILSYLSGFDQMELVHRLFNLGFDPIELGGDLAYLLPSSFAPPAIESLKNLKEQTGLSYTVHLPLWSIEPSTPVPAVRRGSVEAVLDLIRATTPLDPEVYVLHATGSLAAEFYRMRLPEIARAILLHQFQDGAHQSLLALLAESGIPPRKLAIETIEFPFDLTLELAEALDLSMCFDTGHVLANFAGELDFFAALERCLPRLGEIHLHDCPAQGPGQIGYGQDHQSLGSGSLQLDHLLGTLVAANFTGPVVFELQVEEAQASLDLIRALMTGR